jgi:hypothetical protein
MLTRGEAAGIGCLIIFCLAIYGVACIASEAFKWVQ